MHFEIWAQPEYRAILTESPHMTKQADVCREFNVKPPLLSRKVADLNEVSDIAKEV